MGHTWVMYGSTMGDMEDMGHVLVISSSCMGHIGHNIIICVMGHNDLTVCRNGDCRNGDCQNCTVACTRYLHESGGLWRAGPAANGTGHFFLSTTFLHFVLPAHAINITFLANACIIRRRIEQA